MAEDVQALREAGGDPRLLRAKLLADDRQYVVQKLKALGYNTVGARTQALSALREWTDEDGTPMQVTIQCSAENEELRMVARLPESWLNQPVTRLVRHFAERKLPSSILETLNVDEQLRLASEDGSLVPPAHKCGGLEHGATYQLVKVPLRDSIETGSPYYLPLSDESVRHAVRQRDPREIVDLRLEPPPRFDVDDPLAYQYLEEHGYVVFADALGGAEAVQRAIGLFWDFMERGEVYEVVSRPAPNESAGHQVSEGCGAAGQASSRARVHIDRVQPSTWDWAANPINGIIQADGLGQSDFLWYVRTRPRVLEAFSRVWGVEGASELLCSFDGCSAFRPYEVCPQWRTMSGWWHVDQNALGRRKMTGRAAMQALVSMYDQSVETGAFAVLPGTHRHFDDLCERYKKQIQGGNQFVPLRGEDPLVRDRSAQLVSCRAGDMVVWDSRTIHCSMASLQGAVVRSGLAGSHVDDLPSGGLPDPRLTRLVAYVCMVPAVRASREVAECRRMYWHFGPTTTHWPDAWEAHFPQPPKKASEGEEQDDSQEAEQHEPTCIWPQWVSRELCELGSRSAIELLGWHGMDDSFYKQPPTFEELRPAYSSWAKAHQMADSDNADG